MKRLLGTPVSPLRIVALSLLPLFALASPALADEEGEDEVPAAEPAAAPEAPAPAAEATPAEGEPAAEEEAAKEDSPRIRVVQQRPFLHSVRFELQLLGGTGVADTMYDHWVAGASGRLHVTEEWSVGGGYEHYFSDRAQVYDDVTGNFEVFPEESFNRFYAGLDVAYSPVYGKLVFFDEGIVHYDLYVLAGGGVTQTSRSTDLKFTGTIGVGARIIATRWLAVVFELRDHIFVETFNAGDELVNNVVFTGGLSIFLPFDYDYVYPR